MVSEWEHPFPLFLFALCRVSVSLSLAVIRFEVLIVLCRFLLHLVQFFLCVDWNFNCGTMRDFLVKTDGGLSWEWCSFLLASSLGLELVEELDHRLKTLRGLNPKLYHSTRS